MRPLSSTETPPASYCFSSSPHRVVAGVAVCLGPIPQHRDRLWESHRVAASAPSPTAPSPGSPGSPRSATIPHCVVAGSPRSALAPSPTARRHEKKLAKALKYAVSQMQDISKKFQETASFCYTDEDHVDGYCSEDSALRANVFLDEELSTLFEPQTLGEHCAMYDLDFEEMWDRAMPLSLLPFPCRSPPALLFQGIVQRKVRQDYEFSISHVHYN
ncbi:hypothetical protein GUJ93_ZPchr0002g26792 [Zizania palustris]|uniref:Uncharacterized protein n=1 Tax=Zizania palustris TaxID=103762 RepID=A0A8J5RVF3_ZIZPA|nr:hypothetical protein GUJ93_ZPchr0002g26792 [Zizania palustris]